MYEYVVEVLPRWLVPVHWSITDVSGVSDWSTNKSRLLDPDCCATVMIGLKNTKKSAPGKR